VGNLVDAVPKKSNWWKWALGVVGVVLVGGYSVSINSSGNVVIKADELKETGDDLVRAAIAGGGGETAKMELFDDIERYVLEDFDSKPVFASFLPGIAGLYGKPMWAFYVNRGQGVSTFGTESKEYPMLEFNAANKAYQLTPLIGFRTFIKGARNGKEFLTEPFSPSKSRASEMGKLEDLDTDGNIKPKRVMYVGANEVEIKELDYVNNIEVNVTYIILPMEDFGGLVRRTTFTNTDSKSSVSLQILDGLAKIEPSGGEIDWSLKNMGRTLEGWFGVYHADDTLTMPYFRMSTETGDTAMVTLEKHGHYVLSFIENDGAGAPPELLPIVYDSDVVFGQETSLIDPAAFAKKTVKEILEGNQYGDAKTSSAFSAVEEVTLAPGESVTIVTFYGKTDDISKVPKIAKHVTEPGYVKHKFEQARKMVDDLTSSVQTKTAAHLFNGAIKQMFLDNSLRGGLPVMLGNVDGRAAESNLDEDPRVKAFHVFSRIHGDLERDYNQFVILPTYFSQGPGAFRDVAQNRRNDVIFQPRMASFDVRMFLSFIQADAYEPLTVEAVSYKVPSLESAKSIADRTVLSDPESNQVLVNILSGGGFRPGQVLALIEQLDVTIDVSLAEFVDILLSECDEEPIAVFKDGYWGDHWDYYLDLINSYLSIYPDGEEALMYGHQLKYFFSPATVKPRSERYVVTFTYDGKSKHIIQLHSTDIDDEKVAEQKEYLDPETGLTSSKANWQRTSDGKPFTSTPIAKLFLLGLIKFTTRDAYGMGVEYEGGKPGWNDAMNGLVGMVGSGMPETFELKLLLEYVLSVLTKYGKPLVIPSELNKLIGNVTSALDTLDESGYADSKPLGKAVPADLFTYWDSVTTAREEYREETNYYFSGETEEISAETASQMLKRWITQVNLGIGRAMELGSQGFGDSGDTGIPPCYFAFNITDWVLNGKSDEDGLPLADAKAMSVQEFPLFLEGPVRYMKTISDQESQKAMYDKVFDSGLRDTQLKMYTVSASLKGQSFDMGRMMAFAPGWLENQSVWLHMSYKYYLELLRGKLYQEFFSEMTTGILPYMDPDVYGRSLMECSSFIASSAFSDPFTVGRGFSARLSGSTAEFISMWVLMFIGPNPFFLEDGELRMQLVPAIPEWMFGYPDNVGVVASEYDENVRIVSFKLFSAITVTHHNPEGMDLFGVNPKSYNITYADGQVFTIDGPSIPFEHADKIRRVIFVDKIDAYF